MSWKFWQKRARVEEGTGKSFVSNPWQYVVEYFAGGSSAAGVAVNERTALALATVYGCVRVLSETVASLPLHVYRREGSTRRLAARHWAYPLLHDSPNAFHTAFQWKELLMVHAALWGNHYSRIEWLQNGAASELLPLMPWQVTVRKNKSGTAKVFRVELEDGVEDLPDDEVVHIPALGYDGLVGIRPIQQLKNAVGLAKAAETFGSKFFANGARPGVILETPGRMKQEAAKQLALSVAERYAGADNAFKVMVMEEGAKLHTVQMPLEDAQFLDTRKFQRSEICAAFRVPPHMVADLDKATFSNIEQQDLGFAKHTITPWLVRIEQEINRKLFGRGTGLYAKFNMDGLLRGDFKSRMEGYQIAAGGPFISRAEVRELEDWPVSAEPGMDQVLTPLNMGVGATPEKPDPAPAPAPADDNGGEPPQQMQE